LHVDIDVVLRWNHRGWHACCDLHRIGATLGSGELFGGSPFLFAFEAGGLYWIELQPLWWWWLI
jgi:hypothetical protein